MMSWKSLVFVGSVLLGYGSLSEANVVKLSDDNFDATIAANDTMWLILFASPACKHCKLAAELMKKVAPRLEGTKVGRLHCPVDGYQQCQRFDVHSVPRLSLISGSQDTVWHYNKVVSTSTEEDIIEFVNKGYETLLPLPLPAAPPPKGPSYVEVLSDGNISLAEVSEDTWIIDFYSPDCVHCRSLEPIFAELSVQLKDSPNVQLAAVNVKENELAMKRYRVIAYPTILAIKEGKYYVYEGARTLEKLKEFANDPTGSVSRPLPGQHWGYADQMAMLYDEIADVLHEVWSTPHLRQIVLVSLGGSLIFGPIAAAFLLFLINHYFPDANPEAVANAVKKNN